MQLPVELKLPIGDVVSAAFRLPIQMADTLWAALRWPILLLVVVRIGTMNMGGEQLDIPLLLGLSIVLVAITAMIAVPAHQLFITGKTEHPPGLRFGSTEMRYAGWTLGLPVFIVVLASLVAMPLVVVSTMSGLAVFGTLGLFIALIVAILVYGRFSMIFPRIALGLEGGLRAAGDMAAGHYWRVGVLGIVFPLLISVLPLFLQSTVGGLVGNILSILVSVYFNLVQVAILALIFRWLREFEPASQEQAQDDDDDNDPFDGEQPWLDDTSRKD